MQITIILYIWLALRCLRHVPAAGSCLARLYDKSPKKNKDDSKNRPKRLPQVESHRLVIQSTLVEFQEAQCFFMIAIQVASIVAMSQSPNLYGADNMTQLAQNASMSKNISIGALLTITFGLCLLCRAKMASWYTLLCSTVAIILSIAAFHMSSRWTPLPDELASLQEYGGFHECGHHLPPLIWCGYSQRHSVVGVTPFGAISLSLYGLLFLTQVFEVAWHHWSWDEQYREAFSSEWAKRMLKAFGICVELGFVAMIAIYISDLVYPYYYIGMGDWNFGQVVAVSIWAPVFFKYFYWSWCEFASSISYLLLILY